MEETKTRLVGVRALPRQGFDYFNRGGHRWPVGESPVPKADGKLRFPPGGRTVRVTDRLLAVLRKEPMLSVDLEPSGDPETDALDLIDNFCGDRAHNDGFATREALKALEAEKAILENAAKVAALKAEIAALRAKASAPVTGDAAPAAQEKPAKK